MRLCCLEAQSLWYDEGTSAALAGRGLADILTAAANDIHPPLYYAILSGWSNMAGSSDFSLRALSALLGTALVAVTLRIAAGLWREHVTVVGLMAAMSPLLVWYAQEARMYMLGALLGAILVGLALAYASAQTVWSARGRAAALVAGFVVATAVLYTHYLLGACALLAANLGAAAWLATAPGRRAPARAMVLWFGAQALACVSLLPWLARAWPALSAWPAVGPRPSVVDLWIASARVYALGPKAPPRAESMLPWIIGLAAAGALAMLRPRTRAAATVSLAYAASAPLILTALAAARPAWDAKFLVAGAPGFEILAGAGLVTVAAAAGALTARLAHRASSPLSRALATAVGTGLLLAALWPRAITLQATFGDPMYQRDDYRGIALTVAARAGTGDAVLLDAPTQVEVFDRYADPAIPSYPLPEGRRPPRAATEANVARIAARHRDLFAVLWATDEADPDGVVEGWLNRNRYKVSDHWFGNVRLAIWASARRPMADVSATDMAAGWRYPVVFGNQIALWSLRMGPSTVPAGDVATIEARWSGGAISPRTDYVVFLHLVDDAGRVIAQRDMAPLGGSAQTSAWSPSSPGLSAGGPDGIPSGVVRDLIGLAIPLHTAPGRYRLQMGLYDPASGTRLAAVPSTRVASGPYSADALTLGMVEVVPSLSRPRIPGAEPTALP